MSTGRCIAAFDGFVYLRTGCLGVVDELLVVHVRQGHEQESGCLRPDRKKLVCGRRTFSPLFGFRFYYASVEFCALPERPDCVASRLYTVEINRRLTYASRVRRRGQQVR